MRQVKASLFDITGRSLSAKGDSNSSFMLPFDIGSEQLTELTRALLLQSQKSVDQTENADINEQTFAFSVAINDRITLLEQDATLDSILTAYPNIDEVEIKIIAAPQALFRVHPATRCTGTLEGHTDSVLYVSFSPNGKLLASGSGDCSIRLWDTHTATSFLALKDIHRSWVMALSWSPDGTLLASGDHASLIAITPLDSTSTPMFLKGHTACITQLSWQPLHLASHSLNTSLLASASKDHTVRIWNPISGTCLQVLSQHTDYVSAVKWSGLNSLFTGARDRLIHQWQFNPSTHHFQLISTLKGHAHWINHLALSTDAVIRTGQYQYDDFSQDTTEKLNWEGKIAKAASNYNNFVDKYGSERLVSASDDHTLILWLPSGSTFTPSRLVGHQALVTQALFSPDARWIASCSFDKSVKLWDAHSGEFIASLRGHVSAVYQLAWSADSRMLLSGAKDTTLITWNISKRKIVRTLSGHLDEVYAVDWAPDGQCCASGSKDRTVKLWRP